MVENRKNNTINFNIRKEADRYYFSLDLFVFHLILKYITTFYNVYQGVILCNKIYPNVFHTFEENDGSYNFHTK